MEVKKKITSGHDQAHSRVKPRKNIISRSCFTIFKVPVESLRELAESFSRRRAAAFCLCAMVVFVPACRKKPKMSTHIPPAPHPESTVPQQRPAPSPGIAVGYTEEGIASWYGIPFHGRPAADGEIYDMEALVAAHRTLPFNTWLKVTNLSNGKNVTLRVIDRGPFVDGRIIDLSKAAARQIDLLGPGTGRVRLEVVSAPPYVPSQDFYAVQVGAFSIQANAERARAAYAQRFGTAAIAPRQGAVTMWRVLVGKEPTIASAQQLATTLKAENKDVFVVRLDHVPPPQQAKF
jgi:rare lipoprotein A